jgi:hypothetical protein
MSENKPVPFSASNPAKMNSENRKMRNRLSQQAFRARQAMRIKELEERLGQEPMSEAARTKQLQDTNATLRKQLLDCHKKFCSLQISMKTLAATTAVALGLDPLEDVGVSSTFDYKSPFLTCFPPRQTTQTGRVIVVSAQTAVKSNLPLRTGLTLHLQDRSSSSSKRNPATRQIPNFKHLRF